MLIQHFTLLAVCRLAGCDRRQHNPGADRRDGAGGVQNAQGGGVGDHQRGVGRIRGPDPLPRRPGLHPPAVQPAHGDGWQDRPGRAQRPRARSPRWPAGDEAARRNESVRRGH